MSGSDTRFKVACINWNSPDAPHAMSYVLIDGEMSNVRFWPTWRDAIAYSVPPP